MSRVNKCPNETRKGSREHAQDTVLQSHPGHACTASVADMTISPSPSSRIGFARSLFVAVESLAVAINEPTLIIVTNIPASNMHRGGFKLTWIKTGM